MQKAAVYVRVSTDSDAQRDSPAHQISSCTEYALAHGFEVSKEWVYNDAGLSGTELQDRPAVQRLLADARFGVFDAVLFTAISRFSRDLSDAFQMKKTLESIYGIRLISIEEGYDSAVDGRNNEMVFTVHAMLAAHKSKEMSVAIQRGLREAARRGRHTGNMSPYGYLKGPDKTLRPDPETADVVRNIFELYLNGCGAAEIARHLNRLHVPTATSLRTHRTTSWQPSSVTAILHNPAYMGTIVAHKWTVGQDVQSSRKTNVKVKKTIRREQSEWVVVENSHEPIVDAETFDKVQTMAKRKAGSRADRRNTNCLAGLLVCGDCGGPMLVSASGRRKSATAAAYRYVVCGKTRRLGKAACSNHQSTRYDHFLDSVLHQLSNLFQQYQGATCAPDGLQRKLRAMRETDRARLESLRTLRQRTLQEQYQNLRAFQTGWFSVDLIRQEQTQLAQRLERICQQIERVEAALERSSDVADLDSFRAQVDPFAVPEDGNETRLRAILRTVIDKVVFTGAGQIQVLYRFSAPDSKGDVAHQ